MARITRRGRTLHPDEVRAGALDAPAAPEPDARQLEVDRLEAAGFVADALPSHWWTGPEGARFRGRAAALRALAG